MSSKEVDASDFMKMIITSVIGLFILAYYIINMCFNSNDNKKEKFEKKENEENEEKIVKEKEEIKYKEINNEINKIYINGDKSEEKKIVKKRKKDKNKANKNVKKEENKIFDFVVDDDRDGKWETVEDKKNNIKRKEQRDEEEKKTEKYYNDYLNKF